MPATCEKLKIIAYEALIISDRKIVGNSTYRPVSPAYIHDVSSMIVIPCSLRTMTVTKVIRRIRWKFRIFVVPENYFTGINPHGSSGSNSGNLLHRSGPIILGAAGESGKKQNVESIMLSQIMAHGRTYHDFCFRNQYAFFIIPHPVTVTVHTESRPQLNHAEVMAIEGIV